MATDISLTKNQFDILVNLVEANRYLSQRELSQAIGVSVGTINKTISELNNQKLLSDGYLTEKAKALLESYRVRRAVFIAAGFGARLVPITLNTPKPLVRVKGKRMIETSLDAITALGITEIYIVRGYLGEQFDDLLHKYPTIKFIENPDYNIANSIMSAYYAREHFQNAYILDSDLILMNPSLLTKYQYSSNYLGIYSERTDDWCFITKNKYIEDISLGGEKCHQWVGISYWTKEDGEKLAMDICDKIKQPGGKEVFWDEVPLKSYKDNYNVYVRECMASDVIEIDTFRELKNFDKTYDVI